MPRDEDVVDAETRGRLGSVERAILDLLEADGGPVTRSSVVHALYPSLRPDPAGDQWTAPGHATGGTQRSLVEATVSRAVASLVRKGLIVREPQRATGRTILRRVREAPLPDWESVARDEEDFAARAASRAEHWRTLARRARRRAMRIREERRLDTTGDERAIDVHMAERLHWDSSASNAHEVIHMPRFSLSRTVLQLMRRDSGRVSVVKTNS